MQQEDTRVTVYVQCKGLHTRWGMHKGGRRTPEQLAALGERRAPEEKKATLTGKVDAPPQFTAGR